MRPKHDDGPHRGSPVHVGYVAIGRPQDCEGSPKTATIKIPRGDKTERIWKCVAKSADADDTRETRGAVRLKATPNFKSMPRWPNTRTMRAKHDDGRHKASPVHDGRQRGSHNPQCAATASEPVWKASWSVIRTLSGRNALGDIGRFSLSLLAWRLRASADPVRLAPSR